jgi:diguanylate cyclase (GGDEF)-like protein/PAS domain S-box-containing protein
VLLKANGTSLPIVKTVVAAVVGERKCLIESFFDITPQKQAEHALKEANERLALELDERGRMEKALRESEERYSLAVRGANDGLWDWDLQTNQVYYSPRWKSMLGWAEDKVGHSPNEWLDRVHPDDLPQLQADLASHLNRQSAPFESEYRIRHCDDSFRWMLCRGLAAWNDEGKAFRMAGSQTDITRRKIAEEKLAHDALHDPLTGLPNRVLFMDRLAHAVKRTRRAVSNQSAVLFLDLDRFKWINDSLGHGIGDQILAAIGQRLESCIRPGDTVARFGGDEFTILLDGVLNLDDATRIAERVQVELQKPFPVGGHDISISASIGIADCSVESPAAIPKRPDEILRDADTAMYRAKSMGRARQEVFDNSMHAHAVARLQMVEGLRRALERQEFRVHYQPIFSLRTGAVTTVEALLRWQHPERGLILPGEFIPIAEETGLIVPIGEWVFRTACAQAVSWHAAGYPHLEMAVNCSARQFQEPHLATMIGRILRETGLPAPKLQIEITESTAMNDGTSNRALGELNAMGVQISLDDFGDGYSALANLKHLPLSILKIDQSLMRGIALDPGDAAIATAIIALARSLNLRAIAEGVETQEEQEFLTSRQCDEVQGFLFSRPVLAEKITELLREYCPIDSALVAL